MAQMVHIQGCHQLPPLMGRFEMYVQTAVLATARGNGGESLYVEYR
jgi:hypothetical protein